MKKQQIVEIVKKLNFENDSFCILGSASLVIRNIKKEANDIDIAVTESNLIKIKKIYHLEKVVENIYKTIISNCIVEFIVKAKNEIYVEFIDGYPLQELNSLLENKKNRGLEKDKNDIKLINNYLIKIIKEKTLNGEYTDLYDENRILTGEKVFREKGQKSIVPKGRYTIVVLVIIENSKNKFLLQKTSKRKGGIWSITGGHVKSGQNSLEAIQEEIEEELGLKIDEKEIKLFKTYKYENAFKDVYYVKKDIDISNLKLQLDEVECVEYFSEEEILKFIKNDELRKTNIDAFMDFINVE